MHVFVWAINKFHLETQIFVFPKRPSLILRRCLILRSGASPLMYTEALNSEQLMLVISSLTDTMAGNYYCTASYANSEMLEAKVKVETYGKYNRSVLQGL